jgi:hypothetical protein
MGLDGEQVSRPSGGSRDHVVEFRHVVVWPIRLARLASIRGDYAAEFAEKGAPLWKLVEDEYTGDPADFQERHYSEFVAFLPPVRRFLYGQGLGRSVAAGYGESPIAVLRRADIATARVALAPRGETLKFEVAHVDLHFFFDLPIAILALELVGRNLSLAQAQETMYQFGRAYPTYWDVDGCAGHCPLRVEWLSRSGEALAVSDYDNKRKYLETVCRHRAPAVSTHWEFLLQPLLLDHGDQIGQLRFRVLEYNKMPFMSYLAMADVEGLTRADHMRLALATGSSEGATRTYSDSQLAELEARFGYIHNRESRDGRDWINIHHAVTGHSLVVTGPASNSFFVDAERGYLARFRHQQFLAFLIAHSHRATLLMLSDWLSITMSRLAPTDRDSVRSFRAETRSTLEIFLRFGHRYWFEEVADQVQTGELFALVRARLGVDRLYGELRQELQDMNQYLESYAARRQNNTMVRLTVVTTFGLIGTVTTGLLGMNLIDWAEHSRVAKVAIFLGFLVPVAGLTFFSVARSARLSAFFDALADRKPEARRTHR